ncbi:PucR family transcriptional regulator [Amycolatopsis saalfeldensis]|uniref:DNA-binding transcriptional regulator, PucR family n=1 Tax=Amycolatopsis saalfeldensis TaxID=394193 RepID=A0A1H8XG82_9PSEU|nr:helix-turn-helix domain-containing protein [Amycolatopsis saalfeldensis]SEP38960.1 DNA-binding transcriptional regulator, PucR family [Amycolatopsis saalfeldensis]
MVTPGPSHTTLGRVLDDLGEVLLEPVAVARLTRRQLGGVVIHDPHDDAEFPRHAVVLGVGVREPDEVVRLMHEAGRRGAAALVVRSPVVSSPALRQAADSSGVALLGLASGASWTQLAAMLRTLLSEGDIGDVSPQTLGGLPSGDLFALANAVAALLDAPVTIEDRNSRVLAFSGRQDEADSSRIETVLGRQVPERFTRDLEQDGVFERLYRDHAPVYVDPLRYEHEGISLPRVAVAVRAGDEVLGSIWAAVHEPLSEERTQALVDAAKLVALHLLRLRAGADVERRLRADLVSTALEGGAGAPEAIARLGLLGQPAVVLAMGLLGTPESESDDGLRLVAERQRVADALAMHLSAVQPRAAVALVGDVAYGIVPMPADGPARAVRIASTFLERTGKRAAAAIGIGGLALDGSGLRASRDGADRALRVLLTGGGAKRVITAEDAHVDALMLELADLAAARGDGATGPVARLLDYDARHRSQLVHTLRCWLDAFGDITAASAAAFVHPSTFRYRLRRLAEVGEIDLTDPGDRFAAMLQLRLLPPGTGPSHAEAG